MLRINYSYVKVWDDFANYRGTEVIRLEWNAITLNTWWRFARTTKKYMNMVLPVWYKVYCSKWDRYISYDWYMWLQRIAYTTWCHELGRKIINIIQ